MIEVKPELLAPAGDLEKLKMALIYGADAVYLGGLKYGLRAAAGNFTPEEMQEGVDYAHTKGAKVYVTVNIFAHNRDLEGFADYLVQLQEIGVDALIMSDPGLLSIGRQVVPDMPLHLSTQANTTNWASAKFWREMGLERVVLARELSLAEIREINQQTEIELEAFVHGAMCMSYSGRCLISNFLTGRSANLGECTQPCRWKYSLMEETRPGEFFPIEEDQRGTYIFNAQDLCMIRHIPEMVEAGIGSFKIEGRMKSVHYVATVIKVYRQAIDKYLANPEEYTFEQKWMEEITKVSHRDYTTGFYFGRQPKAENYLSDYTRTYDFVGLVREYIPEKNIAVVEQRNRFAVGEQLEIVGPQQDPQIVSLAAIFNEAGQPIENAPHPQQIVQIEVPFPVEKHSLIRRAKERS